MAKTTFENKNYRTHHGILIPDDLWKRLHPFKAKAKEIVTAAGVALAIAITPSYAGAEEPTTEPQHSVFAGTLITQESIDTLLTYGHKNGATVNLEAVDNLWKDDPNHKISLGTRSPYFLDQLLRTDGIINVTGDENWGYTAFLEAFPIRGLTLRGGAFQNSTDILGGFIGGRFANDFLTVDLDTWYEGNNQGNILGVHGYVAGAIPFRDAGSLYLSVGGDIEKETLHTLTGWINPGGIGVLNRVTLDLEKESQSGLLWIADKSTFTKGKFDFKQHVWTGTEMQGIATDGVLNGWAPFTAYYTSNIGFAGSWNNSPARAGAEGMLYYRPTEAVFIGLGAGDQFVKEVEKHNPFARAELYAKIFGPLEAWINLPIDLNTGRMNPTFYVGGSGTF